VFDINGGEIVILAGVALVVLGPDKLPGYAAQAARLLRQVRTMADNAKDQMKDHLGPEFEDVDWKSLDPRQYDPRRIVRDALMNEDGELDLDRMERMDRSDRSDRSGGAEKPVSRGGPEPVNDAVSDGGSGSTGGRAASYDDEAT
jgi:sec-independent protein translocase protein TatB